MIKGKSYVTLDSRPYLTIYEDDNKIQRAVIGKDAKNELEIINGKVWYRGEGKSKIYPVSEAIGGNILLAYNGKNATEG
ncbi:MAG: hypothetical protein IJ072_01870, partial [Oscillospiraceae bacterium]|nr:hypothetical protein [Oscillospiraceae bacterium]